MLSRPRFSPRPVEARLLLAVILVAFLGFGLTTAADALREQTALAAALPAVLAYPAAFAASLLLIHFVLRWRGSPADQLVLPIAALLVALGLSLLWRLGGAAAVGQQLSRGWLPGLIVVAICVAYPQVVEHLRRRWVLAISGGGLLLLMATAFFGQIDGSGARLSLKIGPLPPVQTAELVKLALIIFLAWYIEQVGEEAEGRARPVGWLRLPALKYFVPGLLFVFLATLALVRMSDFGAILILVTLFAAMLYAGFHTRIFVTIGAIGLLLSLAAGLVLALVWDTPAVIQQRIVAFRDPWSTEELVIDGRPVGVTVAEGPGYQLQQAIYAAIAGGITGAGLGLGSPENVPLAHSDFIFAALAEEMGAAVALAVLAFFAILILRILRLAIVLPEGQRFERLLLVGFGVHIFIQVFVMVGGTLNLLPPTGIAVPFLSQGGVALLVHLTEIGLVLALSQRLEAR